MLSQVLTILKDPAKRVYLKDIIFRLLLYVVSFVEILALPLLLEKELYANFEYLKNAVFLFPIALIGAHSGYTYTYYKEGSDNFSSLLRVGFIVSVILAAVLSAFFQNAYLTIPFILINLFAIFEQKLKINKQFVTAFAFKPLISAVTLIISGLTFYNLIRWEEDENLLLSIVFLMAFIVWSLICRRSIFDSFKKSSLSLRVNLNIYMLFIKKIFTGVMASSILMAYFFLERFYVDRLFGGELPEYSLSFNLVQILIILLTTLSYFSGNLLGERLYTIRKIDLRGYFRLLLLGFTMLVIGMSILTAILNYYIYTEFNSLVILTVIMSLTKGFVFLVGILTPLAVYKDFNNSMMFCMITLIIFSGVFALTHRYYEYNIVQYLTINGLILIVYPLFNLNILFRRINFSH